MMYPRYLTDVVRKDLSKKLVLLSGPRQAGKTTFSKSLLSAYEYINYDIPKHRVKLLEHSWKRDEELVIFDELHKLDRWKSFLKGLADDDERSYQILVTGSAKLDTYRKTGDSLAGRFFPHRLYPFDIKELSGLFPEVSAAETLKNLLITSGFPEPFLSGSEQDYKRWRRAHQDIMLRQDLADLTEVRNLHAVETLVELLKKRVGSPVSYASLAGDLQFSPKTIKSWLEHLETLYMVFKVTPYHKNIARSLLKEPKYYFFDTAIVTAGEGAAFENLVAFSLLKECHRFEDATGSKAQLHYLRTQDGKEVDFCVTVDDIPVLLVEDKTGEENLHSGFRHFQKFFPETPCVQLVQEMTQPKHFPGGEKVLPAAEWLQNFRLDNS